MHGTENSESIVRSSWSNGAEWCPIRLFRIYFWTRFALLFFPPRQARQASTRLGQEPDMQREQKTLDHEVITVAFSSCAIVSSLGQYLHFWRFFAADWVHPQTNILTMRKRKRLSSTYLFTAFALVFGTSDRPGTTAPIETKIRSIVYRKYKL